MGGRKKTEQRLDAFFAYDKLLKDPARTAREDWISAPYDYYGKPTYNPNNEPDLHAPYMYLWAGAPAKTATVTRAAMTLFTDGPDGMTGNDDLGTMSAWYVFSSLGLYPTTNGGDFLAVSSPAVPVGPDPHRRLREVAGRHPDRAGARRERHPAVRAAGHVRREGPARHLAGLGRGRQGRPARLRDGRQAVGVGHRQGAEPPSVNRATADSRRHLDASLRTSADVVPTSDGAQDVRLRLDVLGQAPGALRVKVAAEAPPRLDGEGVRRVHAGLAPAAGAEDRDGGRARAGGDRARHLQRADHGVRRRG